MRKLILGFGLGLLGRGSVASNSNNREVLDSSASDFVDYSSALDSEPSLARENKQEVCSAESQSCSKKWPVYEENKLEFNEFINLAVDLNDFDIRKAKKQINNNVTELLLSYNDVVRGLILGKIEKVEKKLEEGRFKKPCEYAVLALGSFAKSEMIPGSDFEFAILLEGKERFLNGQGNKNPDVDRYFTNFTDLLNEELSPQIPIDTAGTSPWGKKGKNRLLGNKDELLIYQEYKFWKGRENVYLENPYLFSIIGSPTLLYSSTLRSSDDVMKREYNSYISKVGSALKGNVYFVLKSLIDTLAKHKPLYGRFSKEGEGKFKIKYDFYRLPNQILDHLDLYHILEYADRQFRTCDSRLEKLELKQSKMIKTYGARIKNALKIAVYLRILVGDTKDEILDIRNFANREQFAALTNDLYSDLREIYNVREFFEENVKNIKDNSYLMCLKDMESDYHRKSWLLKKEANYVRNKAERKKIYENSLNDLMQASYTSISPYYDLYHLQAQLEARLVEDESVDRVDYSAAIEILKSGAELAKGEGKVTYAKNRRKLGFYEAKRGRVQDAKLYYLEALDSICSLEKFRASDDTSKVVLIKILSGLSKLEISSEDLFFIKEKLVELPREHFGDILNMVERLSVVKDLCEISEGIVGLLHDGQLREEISRKYIGNKKGFNYSAVAGAALIGMLGVGVLYGKGKEEAEKKEESITIYDAEKLSTDTISMGIDFNESFTGREKDLAAIYKRLSGSGSKARVVTSGSGGIGKSTIAREYAYRELEKYRKGELDVSGKRLGVKLAFFIDISGQANEDSFYKLSEAFRAIADRLNSNRKDLGIEKIEDISGDEDNREKQKRIRDEVYDRLKQLGHQGEKYILVFDDARGYKSIKDYLPPEDHVNVQTLITSRDSNKTKWKTKGVKHMDLNIFPPDVSMVYLLRGVSEEQNRHCGKKVIILEGANERAVGFVKYKQGVISLSEVNLPQEELSLYEDAYSLTKVLHNYPLALSHAVAYMNNNPSLEKSGKNQSSYNSIFAKYKDLFNRRPDLTNKVTASDYTMTIAKTLSLSVEQLDEKHKLLLNMSVMIRDHAYIEESQIPDYLKQIHKDQNLPEPEEDEINKAISLLQKHSFIRYSERNLFFKKKFISKLEGYQMHDVVHEVLLGNLRSQENIKDYTQSYFTLLRLVNSIINKHNNISYMSKIYIEELLSFTKDEKKFGISLTEKEAEERKDLFVKLDSNIKELNGFGIVKELLFKFDLLQYFVKEFDIKLDDDLKDKYGMTIVHYVASHGIWDVFEWLVFDKGLDVSVKDKDGKTALHEVAQRGELSLLKRLFEERKLDMSVKDKEEKNLLHYAARSVKVDVLEWLVEEKGLDVSVKDKYEKTLLHEATRYYSLDVLKWLVEKKGLDVSVKDRYGNTLLHEATMNWKLDVLKWLVEEKGLYMSIEDKNEEGKTALECADVNEMKEYLKFQMDKQKEGVRRQEFDQSLLQLDVDKRDLSFQEVALKEDEQYEKRDNLEL